MSTAGGNGSDWEPVRVEGYEHFEEIGRGAFGVVYQARQIAVDRTVAIKVLHGLNFDDRARRRFDVERTAMGKLSHHPNIATVFDSGYTDSGQPFLVMEYLPGGSLADRLDQWGPLDAEEATGIAIRVAGALETSHSSGVAHGDVKPENILLSAYGEPQLSDFGIARLAMGKYPTATNASSGSLAHIAPELLDGAPPGPSADVYSLASTLYALLIGHAPFVRPDDATYLAALTRIQNEPVPDLRAQGVPAGVATAVARATDKDVGARTPSALAFAQDLMSAGQEHGWALPTATVERDTAARVQPPRKARKSSSWAIAAIGTVALAGVAALWFGRGEGAPIPTTEATVPTASTSTLGNQTATTAPAATTAPSVARSTTTTTVGIVQAAALWVFEPATDTFNDLSSPGVGESLIAIGTGDEYVQTVDRATGEAAWIFPMTDKVQADPLPMPGGGFIVADKKGLIVRVDQGGAELWRQTVGSVTHGPIRIGDKLVITAFDGRVSALDPDDGSVIWSTYVGASMIASATSTASGDVIVGTLVLNPDDGSVRSGSVLALDGESGEILWHEPLPPGTGVWGTPLVTGSTVIVPRIGISGLSELDSQTGVSGRELLLGDFVRASPILGDGIILIGSHEPRFYALDRNRFGYEWVYDDLDGRVDGRAVVVDGIVYLAGGLDVKGLDLASGELRWEYSLLSRATGDLAWSEGILYVADKQGRLYALPTVVND